MQLNAFAARKRLAIFAEIQAGQSPSEGHFEESVLREGRSKGLPQVGSTRYEPNAVTFEFIFPDAGGSAVIFPVKISVPERIVFLPVPGWVVENIWQGDIDGGYHFESDAHRLLAEFAQELELEANLKWFGPRTAKRRE